jgi:hypothetical protein
MNVRLVRGASILVLGLAISCGASQPTPIAPPEPVEVPEVAADAPEEVQIRLVPQYAVRSESSSVWDPLTRTLAVVSDSGHLVLVDGATGLVRDVNRFARRADSAGLVIGGGAAFVFYGSSDGDELLAEVDLDRGEVGDGSQGMDAIASADGSTMVRWDAYEGRSLDVWHMELGDEDAGGTCVFDGIDRPEGSGSDSESDSGSAQVARVAVSPDGKLLAVFSPPTIAIVDARDCAVQSTFDVAEPPRELAIANDGRIAWLVDGRQLIVRDGRTGGIGQPIALASDWYTVRFTPDGHALVGSTNRDATALDASTGAPVELDDAVRRSAFEPLLPTEMPEHDYTGGEYAIHGVWLRPDAEGIVIGQREATVVVTRGGARVVDCIDGEQDLEWSPLEPGVALQGSDGHCDVASGVGTAPAPAPDYGSYSSSDYDEEASGEEEEEEPPPEDDVICATSNPSVCVTFPARGGAPRMSAGPGARSHVIRGANDAVVGFSPDARLAVFTTSSALRIVDVATGRDRMRLPSGEVVDWGPDGHWVATMTTNGRTTFRSLDDVHRSFDVEHMLTAESIVFEPEGGVLVCSESGIERLSLSDGALSPVATTPCGSIRIFGAHAVVHSPGDLQAHVVDLGTGQVLLDFPHEAQPPPAGSTFFRTCDGADRIVIDVAHATSTRIEGTCSVAASTEDGRTFIRSSDFETVTLERADGASLVLHIVWQGEANAYAEAPDHAFWVASEDDAELLNVVMRTGARSSIRVVSGGDPEMRRRFYRPTLLADFLDGRPLPEASP